jgi:hypothetical protein
MATSAAGRRASVKDWVDSNFFESSQEPEKSYERTRRLDPHDFLSNIEVKHFDFDSDTIPAELLDLIK